MSTAYPDRLAFLRSIAKSAEDPWTRDYAAAFIERYERNVDMNWPAEEAWRRAEAQTVHYWRGA